MELAIALLLVFGGVPFLWFVGFGIGLFLENVSEKRNKK